jgi:pimeloyl-ACP methyl ester carboxylesterase
MSTQARPSIVFAHGLWADGSCFSKLIQALQADGHEVMASQHGLDSLASDVAAVKACLTRVSSPAILVGHSYGGTLITHAGTDPRVAGLVYIAALAPDADETSQSLQAKFPTTDVFSYIEIADGRIWLKPDGVVCFAGDLPRAEARVGDARRAGRGSVQPEGRRHGLALEAELVHRGYQGPDRPPELERFVAKRMGATMVETASSHVPMLSNPALVLDVIRKAANAVQTATVSG